MTSRFAFAKDWRSWIIGIAWDKRQVAAAIGPFCWVYWRKQWRDEKAAAYVEHQNTPNISSGGRSARRRRRR